MPGVSREQIQEAFTGRRIPDWHPHQLGHTAATLVRKALGDSGLDAARALLGQKTLAIADVYAEVDQELAVNPSALRQDGAALHGAPGHPSPS
jgi:integrase